ncbi:MAG: glycogen-binding domain-containing protein [Lentisphaeria bacterium]|nr:glycogen-binding domain-containing protein [Lentisphaeria bacterium]
MKKEQSCVRRAVNLEYTDAPGKAVSVAGSFSGWQSKAMSDKNGDGTYRCRLLLAPGVYQYKFLVDGEWRSDSKNPDFVPNEYGSLNSVLTIAERKK